MSKSYSIFLEAGSTTTQKIAFINYVRSVVKYMDTVTCVDAYSDDINAVMSVITGTKLTEVARGVLSNRVEFNFKGGKAIAFVESTPHKHSRIVGDAVFTHVRLTNTPEVDSSSSSKSQLRGLIADLIRLVAATPCDSTVQLVNNLQYITKHPVVLRNKTMYQVYQKETAALPFNVRDIVSALKTIINVTTELQLEVLGRVLKAGALPISVWVVDEPLQYSRAVDAEHSFIQL